MVFLGGAVLANIVSFWVSNAPDCSANADFDELDGR